MIPLSKAHVIIGFRLRPQKLYAELWHLELTSPTSLGII